MGKRKKSSGNSWQVALIACSKTKKQGTHKAKDLYQGDLFKKSFVYCSKRYKQTFILSAKYGLLHPDQIISYYDVTLKNKTEKEKKRWSEKVILQIEKMNIRSDQIVCFAGKDYNKYLPYEKFFSRFKNFGIGKQLGFFKKELNQTKGLIYDK